MPAGFQDGGKIHLTSTKNALCAGDKEGISLKEDPPFEEAFPFSERWIFQSAILVYWKV